MADCRKKSGASGFLAGRVGRAAERQYREHAGERLAGRGFTAITDPGVQLGAGDTVGQVEPQVEIGSIREFAGIA